MAAPQVSFRNDVNQNKLVGGGGYSLYTTSGGGGGMYSLYTTSDDCILKNVHTQLINSTMSHNEFYSHTSSNHLVRVSVLFFKWFISHVGMNPLIFYRRRRTARMKRRKSKPSLQAHQPILSQSPRTLVRPHLPQRRVLRQPTAKEVLLPLQIRPTLTHPG